MHSYTDATHAHTQSLVRERSSSR